jgi:tetratricopeptide (TPR) repeat protein
MHFPRSLLSLILALIASLMPALSFAADDTADEYFKAYLMNNDGDRLAKDGDFRRALDKYQQAKTIFDSIGTNFPTWQPDVLKMRQQKLASAIEDVQAKLNAPPPPPAPAPAPVPAPLPSGALPATSGLNALSQFNTPSAPLAAAVPPPPSSGDPLQDAFEQMKRAISSREVGLQQKLTETEAQIGRQAMLADQMLQQRNEAVKQRDDFYKQTHALDQQVKAQQAKVTALEKQLAGGGSVKAELDKARKDLSDSKDRMTELQERLSTAEKSMMTKSQQLEEATMKLSAVEKDRDESKTKLLGLQAENEVLKKRGPVPENMKDLVAENDRLKSDLDNARKQVATLKLDLVGKDKEITQLKGQLTKIQGELTTLKKENAAYEVQVADLTLELKKIRDLADDPKKAKPDDAPQLMAENQLLKGIIVRQIRQQARAQQQKANVIAEIQKTENASKELIDQVEQLAGNRVTLSNEEQKLFTTPQLQEIMGTDGIKATLMVKGDAKTTGDKPSASATTEEAKKKEADLTQLITKANELLQGQKLPEAASAYEDVLRADPKNATAFAGLAWARIQQDKLDDAESVLKKSLAYEPNNAAAHYMLAVTLFRRDRLNEAMAAFEKSVSIEPKNARARHYLGVISSKMGIQDRAEREFKSALAIDPSYGEADFNLAVLYATKQPPQWDLAKKHYSDAVKKGVKPDSAMDELLKGAK